MHWKECANTGTSNIMDTVDHNLRVPVISRLIFIVRTNATVGNNKVFVLSRCLLNRV